MFWMQHSPYGVANNTGSTAAAVRRNFVLLYFIFGVVALVCSRTAQ